MSPVGTERAEPPVERRKVSSQQKLDTPHLRSMLSAAELTRRPSRPPDYAGENRALIALAQVLATSPGSVLQKLADTALVEAEFDLEISEDDFVVRCRLARADAGHIGVQYIKPPRRISWGRRS